MPAKKSSAKKASEKQSSGSKKSSAAKKSSGSRKSGAKKSTASKRTLIAPKGDKRYVRRDAEGQFKDVVDVGRSLAADRRSKSKTKVKKGQGDRGDVAR